jgi:hypothetical protein
MIAAMMPLTHFQAGFHISNPLLLGRAKASYSPSNSSPRLLAAGQPGNQCPEGKVPGTSDCRSNSRCGRGTWPAVKAAAGSVDENNIISEQVLSNCSKLALAPGAVDHHFSGMQTELATTMQARVLRFRDIAAAAAGGAHASYYSAAT